MKEKKASMISNTAMEYSTSEEDVRRDNVTKRNRENIRPKKTEKEEEDAKSITRSLNVTLQVNSVEK